MFFKRKKKKNSTTLSNYDELVKTCFSRDNLLLNTLLEMVSISPKKEKINNWLNKLNDNNSFSAEFYLYSIKNSKEYFVLNTETVEYMKLLLKLESNLSKCRSLVHSDFPYIQDYIRTELFESTHLLNEIHRCLQGGVPFTHETIRRSANDLYQFTDATLEKYYQKTVEVLEREMETAQTLRKKLQEERQLLIKN